MATVVLRPKANADILRHAGWRVTNVSARSAGRWLTAMYASVNTLADRPEQHPEADEAADLGLDLRFKLHGRRPHVFRILFTIEGDTVNVLRVRHAAQDRLTGDDL